MTYVAPSTVTTLQTYTSAAHNVIVGDIIDHETRIANGEAAWTTWTPSLTGITTGNGTVTAKYLQIGKMVQFRFKFLLGSTSAISASPIITLPVTQATGSHLTAPVIFEDTGSAINLGVSQILSNNIYLYAVNSSTTYAQFAFVSATVPFTWATNDSIIVNGTYEAA